MLSIAAVPPWEARAVGEALWDRFIAPAERRGAPLEGDILTECEARRATLWVISLPPCEVADARWLEWQEPLGLCITSLPVTDTGQALRIVALGGEHAALWLPALRHVLTAYRDAEGATSIIASGRKGWGRVFGIPATRRNADGTWFFEEQA